MTSTVRFQTLRTMASTWYLVAALTCCLAILFPVHPPEVTAWVVVVGPSTRTMATVSSSSPATATTSTSTSLAMFDWLNPSKNAESAKESKSQDSNDFFGNLFKPMTKHHETTTTTKAETAATNVVEDDIPVVTQSESVKVVVEPMKVVEMKEKEPVAVAPSSAVVDQVATPLTPVTTISATAISDTDSPIRTGKVKWFDKYKGYGFIAPWVEAETVEANDDNTEDDAVHKGYYSRNKDDWVFVHYSEIQTPPQEIEGSKWFGNLIQREIVEYQLTAGKDGKALAKHVTGRDGTFVRAVAKQMEGLKQKEQPSSGGEGDNKDPLITP